MKKKIVSILLCTAMVGTMAVAQTANQTANQTVKEKIRTRSEFQYSLLTTLTGQVLWENSKSS